MDKPTGILLLNMGGPRNKGEVQEFLRRVLSDRELLKLPFQRTTAPLLARLQTRSWQRKYAAMGGGSPLHAWTERQGELLAVELDRKSPETAPHYCYTCFRYNSPDTREAIQKMHADGVRRVIAFTQYPQYSCTTTGASLHELWRQAKELGLLGEFEWSVIDRFGSHPSYITALAKKVQEGLAAFPAEERDDAVVVYSAHTLPTSVIDAGDPYLQEVTATVAGVAERLCAGNAYVLAFQEARRWFDQGPDTARTLAALARQGRRRVLVVGVAFTSDHEETLWELDTELAEQAERAGITRFQRAPALNDDPAFIGALADVVLEHLATGRAPSGQFGLRCADCTDRACRAVPDTARPAPVRHP